MWAHHKFMSGREWANNKLRQSVWKLKHFLNREFKVSGPTQRTIKEKHAQYAHTMNTLQQGMICKCSHTFSYSIANRLSVPSSRECFQSSIRVCTLVEVDAHFCPATANMQTPPNSLTWIYVAVYLVSYVMMTTLCVNNSHNLCAVAEMKTGHMYTCVICESAWLIHTQRIHNLWYVLNSIHSRHTAPNMEIISN